MCGVLVLASRSTSTTLKITHLPSGETAGSPTRFSFIMSSKVNGCFAWATAGNENAMSTRKAGKKRRMRKPPRNQIRRDLACYVSSRHLQPASGGKTLQATSLRQTEKCSRVSVGPAEHGWRWGLRNPPKPESQSPKPGVHPGNPFRFLASNQLAENCSIPPPVLVSGMDRRQGCRSFGVDSDLPRSSGESYVFKTSRCHSGGKAIDYSS